MPYVVKVSKEARNILKSLEKDIQIRILRRLEIVKNAPYHFLEKYKGSDLWKLRVGDYRVIIEINENDKALEVLTLGHRKNIYKKRQ
jgi:mRNA interferase RelE/StbE